MVTRPPVGGEDKPGTDPHQPHILEKIKLETKTSFKTFYSYNEREQRSEKLV
jgi:hypothetical protein